MSSEVALLTTSFSDGPSGVALPDPDQGPHQATPPVVRQGLVHRAHLERVRQPVGQPRGRARGRGRALPTVGPSSAAAAVAQVVADDGRAADIRRADQDAVTSPSPAASVGAPTALGDQPLEPRALVARTRTSWRRPFASPDRVVPVVEPVPGADMPQSR